MRKIREVFTTIFLLSILTACNSANDVQNIEKKAGLKTEQKSDQNSNLNDTNETTREENNPTIIISDKNITNNNNQSDINQTTEEENNSTIISSNQNITDDNNQSLNWKPVQFPAKDYTYPFYPPAGKNIASVIFDSSFETYSSYLYLDNGAKYDESIKRKGNRSIRLSEKDEALRVYNIPVTEGKWYTISGYMFAKSLPTDIIRLHIAYAGDGAHINSVNYSLISTSTANEWEEFVIPFYVQKNKNINQVRVTIRNVGRLKVGDLNTSDIWIDDLQLFEAKESSKLYGLEAPSQKIDFNGTKVRIDKLGNWEIKENQTWEAFFPIAIYPDDDDPQKRDNWQIYKDKGFNVITRVNLPDASRVSDLGMYWVWDMGHYGIYDGSGVGSDKFAVDYTNLRNNNKSAYDKLLNFYWDNEQYDEWESIRLLTNKAKEIDIDSNGNRIRPIYMHLDFVAGNKNYYNEKYQFMDIQGTYANDLIYKANDIASYGVQMQGNYNAEFGNFSLFENINKIKTPKSIFVINSPFEVDHIESLIFAAIARGGKGFAFWKDGGSQPAIETKSWWDDFGNVTKKIQKLLPIIREPHWTDWELKYNKNDDENGMVVGTRDYNGKRVMIVASRSERNESVTFTTTDKVIGDVRDYYTNAVVAKGVGNSFSLELKAYESGVYYWK